MPATTTIPSIPTTTSTSISLNMFASSSRSASPASTSRSSAPTTSFDSSDRSSPLFNPSYQIVSPASSWLDKALSLGSATDPLLASAMHLQPVYSLEDSVAILRGQGPSSSAATAARSSTVSRDPSLRSSAVPSLLKRYTSRLSFRTSSRSRSSSPSRPVKEAKEKKSAEEVMVAYGYRVPTYDLEESVKILRRRRDGSQ